MKHGVHWANAGKEKVYQIYLGFYLIDLIYFA
jgi:hypothetical protein